MKILVPVSLGELLDKISILKIKKLNIQDKDKLKNISNELDLLTTTLENLELKNKLDSYLDNLYKINLLLWNLEESIRLCKLNDELDIIYNSISKTIRDLNDLRSKTKRKINLEYNSNIIEEKSFQ